MSPKSLERRRDDHIRAIAEHLRWLETRPVSLEVVNALFDVRNHAKMAVDLHNAKYPLEVPECKSSVIPDNLFPPFARRLPDNTFWSSDDEEPIDDDP